MSELFLGIEHLAIASKSPEALASFYVETLGFKVKAVFENTDGLPPAYMIGLGSGPMLEIVPADRVKCPKEKQNNEAGLVHLAITVRDFNAAVEKLRVSTARPEGEERAGAHGARVRFYRDIEGNLFHILWRPQVL